MSRNKGKSSKRPKHSRSKKQERDIVQGHRWIFAQIAVAIVMLLMAFVWLSLFNFSLDAQRENFFTGTVGFDAAHYLVNFFGVTSWIIPVLWILVVLSFFYRKMYRYVLVNVLNFYLMLPLFYALSEHVTFYGTENENYFGQHIYNSYFYPYFGKTGFFMIIFCWLIIYSVISFNFSYFFVFRKMKNACIRLRDKLRSFKLIEDERSNSDVEEEESPDEVSPPENIELHSLGGMDPSIADLSELQEDHSEKKERSKEEKISVTVPEKAGSDEEKRKVLRDFKDYKLPPLDILAPEDKAKVSKDREKKVQHVAVLLERKLLEHRIRVSVKGATIGPVVTMFEVELGEGVRVSQISAMEQDLSVSAGGKKVRVVDRLPGKPYIGIEVPNDDRLVIRLKTVLKSDLFASQKAKGLPIALGQDVDGKPYVANLSKMPHLLVAGTTGSGKSVGINSFIMSLLFNFRPDEVKFVMIDPKGNEFNIYEGIPHLLLPVVVDSKKAAKSLMWAVNEMEDRFKKLAENMVRDIESYNLKVDSINRNLASEDHYMSRMPYIVVVIDEFADLMMVAGKDVEIAVSRIAQKARAVGIHLIVATQRPTRDVVTGLIKGNLPVRIGFRVASSLDSRTILDCNGAELLLGHGDMLYIPPGSSEPVRVHGAFVSTEEIKTVVKYIKRQCPENNVAEKDAGVNISPEDFLEESENIDGISDQEKDPLYDEILSYVVKTGKCSASMLQRKFKIGYNRASRAVDQLEEEGIISPQDGAKPRSVLVQDE